MRKNFPMMLYTCGYTGLFMLISVFCYVKTVNQEVSKNILIEKSASISEYNYLNSKIESVLKTGKSKFVIKFSPLKRLKTKFNNLNLPVKNKFYSAVLSKESKYTDFVYADLSYLKFLRISRMLC